MRIRALASSLIVSTALVAAVPGLMSPAGAAGKGGSSGGGGGGKTDTTAPAVSIATPGSGSSVSGTVAVSGSSSDNASVASVSVSVDGGAWQVASGTRSWSWSWSTAGLGNGTHTVSARAVDSSGNAASTSVSVSVSNAAAATAGDTSAPAVAFSTPAAGATVSGSVGISGTASDNAAVAKVEVMVDGGAWQPASGTTGWTWTWSTSGAAAGSHTLTARATDSSGNTSSTTRSVSIASTSGDTAPPALAITTPAQGSTVSGTVSVQGTVSDNVGVSRLEVAVDGKPWQQVYAKASWAWPWVTGNLSNGTHTLHVRATDTSGNATNMALNVTVSNPCSDGKPVLAQAVTAEGVVIRICTTTGGWTTSAIETLLRQNARDLATIGKFLVIEVQTTYQTGESTGMGSDGYSAALYLNPGASTSFTNAPDALMAHEYGHAWTTYWENMNPANNGSWDRYLAARGLSGDSRVNSSYNWSAVEMVADDYRRLFGSAAAQSQLQFINSAVPDSQAVAGLADFFVNQWAIP